MMKNSTGMLGDGGIFRSHAVYAQDHVYLEGDPVQLERGCASILASYNDAIRNGTGFIVSAADLFYKNDHIASFCRREWPSLSTSCIVCPYASRISFYRHIEFFSSQKSQPLHDGHFRGTTDRQTPSAPNFDSYERILHHA
jgi:hypothetical protein